MPKEKFQSTLQPGKEYKALVKKKLIIGKMVEFPHRVEDLLDGRFGIRDEQARTECSDKILKITTDENMDEAIQNILHDVSRRAGIGNRKISIERLGEKSWICTNGRKLLGAYEEDIYSDYPP